MKHSVYLHLALEAKRTCNFSTNNVCSCGISSKVDYTDHMMWDVLIAGIYDTEIRRDILRVEGITEKSINEVTSLVGKHEMAKQSTWAK